MKPERLQELAPYICWMARLDGFYAELDGVWYKLLIKRVLP